VARRLRGLLEGARITIVDAKEEHNDQPGYTLVASGVWPASKVRDRNADFQPAGVSWVREMVAGFDPASNSLTTTGGQRIAYDFLVVATGVMLDYAQIQGMDLAAIGSHGLASVYPGTQAASATWAAMRTFSANGGNALMTLPATPLKCAGAPLKMTFVLRDRLRQAGTLDKSRVQFVSALGNVFGVKVVNDNVLARWQQLGIEVEYSHKLVAIDIGARRASFVTPEGEKVERPCDFIHVVPPMRAPIVARNRVEQIAGRKPDEAFDGYTSCPLITREGSAMLIEFDYEGRLTPSLPMIEPLQDSYFAWLMKVRMLKPAYLSVLKGRV
jgi:sulfide:quinone oxidoreductase